MDGLLEKLSSAQILAAIAILVGGVVALTMILSISRYQLRALEDDTELRREQQQGELALRNRMLESGLITESTNLDALLTPVSAPLDALSTEVATRFGMLELDASDIEDALKLALAAPAARKQAIVTVMDNLFEHEAEHEAILAAVRPLLPVPEKAPVCSEL